MEQIKQFTSVLYVVATPIGNLQDLSERSMSVLKQVDFIAAEDTRISKKIAELAGSKAKMLSHHKFNENNTVDKLLAELIKGASIALVSDAGTPCLSDPGWVLVNAALDNNIRVIPIPGPSALTAAISACGFSLPKFTFLGFLPRSEKDIITLFEKAHESRSALIFFESPQRISASLELIKAYLLPDCSICLIKEISKRHETIIRGDAASIALGSAAKITNGEWVVIIKDPRLISVTSDKGHRSLNEVAEFFKINRSKAAKILSIVTGKSRRELYKGAE